MVATQSMQQASMNKVKGHACAQIRAIVSKIRPSTIFYNTIKIKTIRTKSKTMAALILLPYTHDIYCWFAHGRQLVCGTL